MPNRLIGRRGSTSTWTGAGAGLIMRKLIQKNLNHLTDLFQEHRGDADVLEELCFELKHRSTPAAKKLQAQVESRLAILKEDPQPKGNESKRNRRRPEPRSAPKPVAEAPAIGEAHDALRSTFSEEGELLARWGMSPLLPDDLFESFIEAWRAWLRQRPTADGRSTPEFDADVQRIQAIRKGRRAST
jgi:hypothetical protein